MGFKVLSVDTETTGLDEETCQVLSFAAVLEDTSKPEVPINELPYIHKIFKRDYIKGEPYALNMNKDLIEIIKEGKDERLCDEKDFFDIFEEFLFNNGFKFGDKLKICGKNFSSFDAKFIEKMENFDTFAFKSHHRVLDVGSLFIDIKNDEWVPDLNTCMKRAGVEGTVQHCAYEDAKDVIKVLRTKY